MRIRLRESCKVCNTKEMVKLILKTKIFSRKEDRDKETLWTVSLDTRNNIVSLDMIYMGTATGTTIRLIEVMRPAVMHGAVSIIIAHNHPGGSIQFSNEDLDFKKSVAEACNLLCVRFLDFLVFNSKGDFRSAMTPTPT